MGKSKDSFEDRQMTIASQIGAKLEKSFAIVENYEINAKGIKILFTHDLKTNDDAQMLAEMIDYTLLLYFVEYNKKRNG